MIFHNIKITEKDYLELKQILEEQHTKEFNLEDVKEIAKELIDFYLLLEYLEYKEHSTGS